MNKKIITKQELYNVPQNRPVVISTGGGCGINCACHKRKQFTWIDLDH